MTIVACALLGGFVCGYGIRAWISRLEARNTGDDIPRDMVF
jgi:hypothetical protein